MTHATDKLTHSNVCTLALSHAQTGLARAHAEAVYGGDTITASRIQTTMDFLYRAQDSSTSFNTEAVRELTRTEEKEKD